MQVFTFAERTAPTPKGDRETIGLLCWDLSLHQVGVNVSLQPHDATADSRATKIVGIIAIAALRVAVVCLSVVDVPSEWN